MRHGNKPDLTLLLLRRHIWICSIEKRFLLLSSNSSRVHGIRGFKMLKTLALKLSFSARTWTHNGQVTVFLVINLDTDKFIFSKDRFGQICSRNHPTNSYRLWVLLRMGFRFPDLKNLASESHPSWREGLWNLTCCRLVAERCINLRNG